jgi:hypothetical protein
MNSQELRALQEAYSQVYAPQELDEGYKSFPYDKVKAKVKKLKTDRESLGKKPLTGKSDSEIGDTLNKMEKSRNRETRLGLQSNTAHSFVPKQKEKSNRNRPESEKRSKTVEPQKSFGNRLTRSDKQGIRDSYEYDLYDIILSHLLDEGYADTFEAAEAIMVNMSEDWRESIVEVAADQSDKQIDKGVKTTYKAQNVLDNQHQGRSRGLNRLPADERADKTKKMRGRLKSRRDDLFGERNKREDESRAELKKKYGL